MDERAECLETRLHEIFGVLNSVHRTWKGPGQAPLRKTMADSVGAPVGKCEAWPHLVVVQD